MLARVTLAFALLASATVAQQVELVASLSGSQSVPPNASAGHGWAMVRVDTATNDVEVFVVHADLTTPPTMAHLHVAPAGSNGGVMIGLAAAGPKAFQGSATVTNTDVQTILAAGTYVNIHTPSFPGGELRGQVVPAKSTALHGQASGSSVVPPTGSTNTGSIRAVLYEPDNCLMFVLEVGTGTPLGVELREAPAGSNGPLVAQFQTVGRFCFGVTPPLTAAQVASLHSGLMYLVVLTNQFPMGELRAQLGSGSDQVLGGAMTGSQMVPPVATPGQGSFRLTRFVDNGYSLEGVVGGLQGTPTNWTLNFAAPGTNAPPLFSLPMQGNTVSIALNLSSAQLAQLVAGNAYFTVQTTAHPGGEIRGNVQPAELALPYGGGCDVPAAPQALVQAVHLASFKVPTIGHATEIRSFGAGPNQPAVVALGFSNSQAGPVTLPAELTTLGVAAPACYLLVDPVATVLAIGNAVGSAGYDLQVPLLPGIRGLMVHCQFVILYPGANPAGVVVSNALTSVVQ